MEVELTGDIFEWLLADWAGHGDNPGLIFPALQNSDYNDFADKLARVIEKAQLAKKVV